MATKFALRKVFPETIMLNIHAFGDKQVRIYNTCIELFKNDAVMFKYELFTRALDSKLVLNNLILLINGYLLIFEVSDKKIELKQSILVVLKNTNYYERMSKLHASGEYLVVYGEVFHEIKVFKLNEMWSLYQAVAGKPDIMIIECAIRDETLAVCGYNQDKGQYQLIMMRGTSENVIQLPEHVVYCEFIGCFLIVGGEDNLYRLRTDDLFSESGRLRSVPNKHRLLGCVVLPSFSLDEKGALLKLYADSVELFTYASLTASMYKEQVETFEFELSQVDSITCWNGGFLAYSKTRGYIAYCIVENKKPVVVLNYMTGSIIDMQLSEDKKTLYAANRNAVCEFKYGYAVTTEGEFDVDCSSAFSMYLLADYLIISHEEDCWLLQMKGSEFESVELEFDLNRIYCACLLGHILALVTEEDLIKIDLRTRKLVSRTRFDASVKVACDTQDAFVICTVAQEADGWKEQLRVYSKCELNTCMNAIQLDHEPTSVFASSAFLVVGTWDSSIGEVLVFDANSLHALAKFKVSCPVHSLYVLDDVLLVGTREGTVMQFNNSGDLISEKQLGTTPVTIKRLGDSLVFMTNKVYTSEINALLKFELLVTPNWRFMASDGGRVFVIDDETSALKSLSIDKRTNRYARRILEIENCSRVKLIGRDLLVCTNEGIALYRNKELLEKFTFVLESMYVYAVEQIGEFIIVGTNTSLLSFNSSLELVSARKMRATGIVQLDESLIAVASDTEVKLIQGPELIQQNSLNVHTEVYSLAFNEVTSTLAVGTLGEGVYFYNYEGGKFQLKRTDNPANVLATRFYDESTLVSSTEEGIIGSSISDVCFSLSTDDVMVRILPGALCSHEKNNGMMLSSMLGAIYICQSVSETEFQILSEFQKAYLEWIYDDRGYFVKSDGVGIAVVYDCDEITRRELVQAVSKKLSIPPEAVLEVCEKFTLQ